jgi:hypothetical protein
MDQAEFLKQQYISLREEVRETKDRIFKTLGFGLIVVPGTHALGDVFHLNTVVLALPILIVVVALIYLSENNALMRCGRYIKNHIEPQIKDVLGWESWLEDKSTSSSVKWKTRNVDRNLSYAFFLLYFVYYFGAVFVAADFAAEKYGITWKYVCLIVYLLIGIWFIFYLLRNILISTTDTQ